MATPLGGPSQIIVKARNNSATIDIQAGDVVELVTTTYDTDQVEPILYVVQATAATGEGPIGVAQEMMRKGTAAGKGEYGNVVIFGLVKARCSSSAPGAVAAGEIVVGGGSGADQLGLIQDDARVGGATMGVALQAGAMASAGATESLTWVFLNGISNRSFGGG